MKKEISVQQARQLFLDASRQVFEVLDRENPALAAVLKPHYEEFIQAEREAYEAHPDGNYTLFEVAFRIPNNRWMKFVADYMLESVPTKGTH